MATSVKNNFMNPDLISNLQQALIRRNDSMEEHSRKVQDHEANKAVAVASSISFGSGNDHQAKTEDTPSKPVVLVTNGDGIDSIGLACLVEALVRDGHLDVHVCAPQSDRSVCGHSVTLSETLAACSTEIGGATAYEVSGTPVDCVSLALSGALFSWSKPVLVISGMNKGSICGQNMMYSGAVSGAREALICDVPSLCISLDWKKNVSSESDLKDAVTVCLPLILAAIRDIKKGIFPKNCFLNIGIPSCPLTNKGVKVTRESTWRSSLSWYAVSANRLPSAGQFMSSQQSLGIMLAQLGRDASAAGAARRLNSHRKNVEIESVGVAGNHSPKQTVKKHFKSEFIEKNEQQIADEDHDFIALEKGFITVTPSSLSPIASFEIQSSVSNWIAVAFNSHL